VEQFGATEPPHGEAAAPQSPTHFLAVIEQLPLNRVRGGRTRLLMEETTRAHSLGIVDCRDNHVAMTVQQRSLSRQLAQEQTVIAAKVGEGRRESLNSTVQVAGELSDVDRNGPENDLERERQAVEEGGKTGDKRSLLVSPLMGKAHATDLDYCPRRTAREENHVIFDAIDLDV